jgi:uncharacterized protein YjbI with pentapeptide repeats
VYAHLQDAYFVNANLEGANFGKANLNGADFEGANLQRAVFSHPLVGAAELNETTTLPDGSNYNPEQGLEQLERFTNPEHQDFWRSDDPDSPAYRGNEEDDE